MKKLIKYPFQKLYKFFLWSSGADLAILEKAQTDANKYFGIGGTIIFTSLMASFAGGYAFFTAFNEEMFDVNGVFIGYTTSSQILSIFFGLFWGALIFNLDRYIVSTFGVGDGKRTISKQELIEAAPRLIMAMLLGFVIATPLELKLFEREINAEISTQIAIVNGTIIKSGENDPVLTRLKDERRELSTNITNRNKIIEDKRTFWENANKDKNDEWNLGKFSGKRGKGGYYDDLKKVADESEASYLSAKNEFTTINTKDYTRIDEIDKKITLRATLTQSEIESRKTIQAQNDGLIARLKALDNLMYQEIPYYEIKNGEKELVRVEREKTVVWYAKWLITLLFIFIEIAPIMFKMMTERGTYDDILDRIKHEAKVKELLLQSNINQEVNMAVKLHKDKNEQKLNAELLANKDLLKSISSAQAEIAKVAIEEWKKEQLDKVTKNPSSMIKS
ncbi:hypothetical protein BST83_10500 [Polaribacter filamentus]|uniref:DUF4407 domain-containing protein n=1 Tax=Polaribacter filamentus TaxID=53483 RepID=A0A2S7KYI8_9FLAO|nr:DUF4407 domain-containing protein [Polaribacter filamentus]PQB07538.1 hypothetical protein BST83_10500 [Polaribacter filamentus]